MFQGKDQMLLHHYFWPTTLVCVYESSVGFTLSDGSVRSPDAAWLSKATFAQLTKAQRERFPPVCPGFVVEVRSLSDGLPTLRRKMEMCLANGVQLGFLLDPTAGTATVHHPGHAPEEISSSDGKLSGESVLPGLELDLAPLRW